LGQMESSEINYEIIEEFIKEDDSVKEEEMKKLKEEILLFLDNDIYLKPSGPYKHKSVVVKEKEIVFNDLLLNIVQMIRKLILFECFTPYNLPSKDTKGKLGFFSPKKEKTQANFSILVRSLLGILEYDTKASEKRKKTQVQKKSFAHNLLGKIEDVTGAMKNFTTGLGQILFASGEKKIGTIKKKKRESIVNIESGGFVEHFISKFLCY